MQDARFDSLLQDVCRQMAASDLTEARRRAPHRPRKALRVAAAAAACAALFTVGAVAVWPKVEMRLGDSRFTLRVEGVNRAAASKVEPIELGYVPEGYTVQYDEYPDGANMTVAIVTDPQGDVLAIHRYGLDEDVEGICEKDGQPMNQDDLTTYSERYEILDSLEDVTVGVFADYPVGVVWPGSDCYYVMFTSYHTTSEGQIQMINPNEILKILESMK